MRLTLGAGDQGAEGAIGVTLRAFRLCAVAACGATAPTIARGAAQLGKRVLMTDLASIPSRCAKTSS
jgi:hypothetical protein